jgi:transposase
MTEEKKEDQNTPAAKKARRHFTVEQRITLLDEADKPGESIAIVARKHGLSPSLLFRWRQLREQGAMTGLRADEELVPASEMKAARTKIRELQRLLGKKTEENEILQEALEIARDRKWMPRLPSLPRGGGR